MTALITTKSPNYLTGKTEVRRQLNLRFVNLVLGVALLILGGYYLVSINDLSVKGFAIRELKSESTRLVSENVDREAEVMQLQAYGKLSSQVSKLNMVAVGEVEYLVVNDNALARK